MWKYAGGIKAKRLIAEPRRLKLMARQIRRSAERKLQAHADPHRKSSLPPHPHKSAHTVRPIRQVADAGDAQRVSLLLPRFDPLLFFGRRRERHHLIDDEKSGGIIRGFPRQFAAAVLRASLPM